MNVFQEHDSLFVQIGKDTAYLKQDKYDWFKIYSRDKQGVVDTSQGFPIEFRTSASGEINEVDAAFEPSVKTIVFFRIPKTAVVQADSLKKYEGEYTIGAMSLKVFLQSKDLHLLVPGQPERPAALEADERAHMAALQALFLPPPSPPRPWAIFSRWKVPSCTPCCTGWISSPSPGSCCCSWRPGTPCG